MPGTHVWKIDNNETEVILGDLQITDWTLRSRCGFISNGLLFSTDDHLIAIHPVIPTFLFWMMDSLDLSQLKRKILLPFVRLWSWQVTRVFNNQGAIHCYALKFSLFSGPFGYFIALFNTLKTKCIVLLWRCRNV